MTALFDPAIKALPHFDGARQHSAPEQRLREVRRRAAGFREEMLSAAPARYFASFSLVRVPYPLRYALLNACSAPTPFVHIMNRLFVVQVDTAHGLRTVLLSPSDVQANSATPFFKRLVDMAGPLRGITQRLLAPEIASVEECLARVGIAPASVDYISYDHLHTQDVRRWLGSRDRPGIFPRAKLLVMRQEWESAQSLLPPQRDWYCPRGIEGIDPDRVVLLDSDVMIGEALAVLRTRGHTEGNHSFVTRTPEGLMVTSENGVGVDSYAPLASAIPGVRRYARATGMEVILNGNTLEAGLDQYISMVMEKEIAGPSKRDPAFPNMVSSSELTSYWAFPGVTPTFSFGDLSFGSPVTSGATE